MELKIQPYAPPGAISFNFDELKRELQEKVAVYQTLVYGNDEIKTAKADRAKLNKLKKALTDERIRQEREYLQPFNEFKAQIKELVGIVDEAVGGIDRQVKEYEELQKEEKLEKILSIWNSAATPDWLTPPQILDEKWLNASVSLASIEAEITARLERIAQDLATLENLPQYGFESVEEYKRTLDISSAINLANRLSEIGKEKAEIAAENKPTEESLKKRLSGEVESEPPVRHWVSFSAYMTVDEATALRIFFESRNIEFEANKQTNH